MQINADELEKIADEIERIYILESKNVETNPNPNRLSLIALYKYLIYTSRDLKSPKMADIWAGAVIAILERIRREYYYQYSFNYFLNYVFNVENSEVFKLFARVLKIDDKHPLTDEDAIRYANKFFQYSTGMFEEDRLIEHMKDTLNPEVWKKIKINKEKYDFVWKDKKELVQDLIYTLQTLRNRDSQRIRQLVYATPENDALRKIMAEMSIAYAEATKTEGTGAWFKSWFKDPSRDPMIRFIDVIDRTSIERYEGNSILQKTEEDTRRGTIAFIVLDIYRKSTFNPEGGWITTGSKLFQLAKPGLGAKTLDEVPIQSRIDWLIKLNEHINAIRKDKKYFNSVVEALKKEKWGSQFGDIKPDLIDSEMMQFQKTIAEVKCDQEELLKQPTRMVRATSTVANYTTQYATYTGTVMLGEYAIKTAAQTIAVSTGPIGTVVWVGGSFLFSGLGTLISNSVLTFTGASIYLWLLSRVGNRAGNLVGSAVGVVQDKLTISGNKDELDELRQNLSQEDEKLFTDWINTLLTLPKEVITDEEKKNIRNVLGLNKDCLLKMIEVKKEVKMITLKEEDQENLQSFKRMKN